jgi:hypothetical protein
MYQEVKSDESQLKSMTEKLRAKIFEQRSIVRQIKQSSFATFSGDGTNTQSQSNSHLNPRVNTANTKPRKKITNPSDPLSLGQAPLNRVKTTVGA